MQQYIGDLSLQHSNFEEMVVSRVLVATGPVWVTLKVYAVNVVATVRAVTLRVTMSAETDTVLVAGSEEESTDTVAVVQGELHRHLRLLLGKRELNHSPVGLVAATILSVNG